MANTDKPVKIGYLKHDIYQFTSDSSKVQAFYLGDSGTWFGNLKDIEKIISEFKSNFRKVLKKNTKFECYLDTDGTELWFDSHGCMEQYKDWAKQNLEIYE